jgi:hypothetical protein
VSSVVVNRNDSDFFVNVSCVWASFLSSRSSNQRGKLYIFDDSHCIVATDELFHVN